MSTPAAEDTFRYDLISNQSQDCPDLLTVAVGILVAKNSVSQTYGIRSRSHDLHEFTYQNGGGERCRPVPAMMRVRVFQTRQAF